MDAGLGCSYRPPRRSLYLLSHLPNSTLPPTVLYPSGTPLDTWVTHSLQGPLGAQVSSLSRDNLSTSSFPRPTTFFSFWLVSLQNFGPCSLLCVECPSLRSWAPTSLTVQVPNVALCDYLILLVLVISSSCWQSPSDVNLHYSLVPFNLSRTLWKGPYYAAQAGFELSFLLPQPPKFMIIDICNKTRLLLLLPLLLLLLVVVLVLLQFWRYGGSHARHIVGRKTLAISRSQFYTSIMF